MICVAAYCRVSTDKEDQANSFEAQQRYFREYIEHHPDWQLVGIYADEGITGTSTRKRTQFNRMIADAWAGKFTLILTKEISRFSRNILDTIIYTRQLKSIGVGVVFLTESLNSLDPEAEMLMTFMGVLAQEESRRTSVRVKWGQTRQMEQGVVFGRSLLGYRVHNGHLTIVPEEAELVRLIFRKYGVEHKGTSVIARELREAGYRTSTGNPNWNNSHILKILRNEKYTGDLIQKKSITPDYLTHAKKANHGEEALVTIRDHHAPIISRELWNAVQSELARRNRHGGVGHSNRYLFSGRIRCGKCGATFVGRQKRLKDGTRIRRWACGTATAGGRAACSVGKLVRDDDARQMLLTALHSLRLDREAIIDQVAKIVLEVIGAGESTPTDTPERLQWQHDAILRKKTAALDAYFAGDISKEEMQTVRNQYDRQLADLETRITAAREQICPDSDAIRQTLSALLWGETESDALSSSILDHLTVFADRHLELRLKGLSHVFHFR